MIVRERWLLGEGLGMWIHEGKVESGKVSASGTGAGDLPGSDAGRVACGPADYTYGL
jgi:hypothetical protein